jgi:voltage-gated potassium channel Kch
MIVVKLLSDRGELDTLPGRVTLGIMLLQDVFAIIVLAIQPNIGGELDWAVLALAPLKGLGLGAGAILVSRYALPHLFKWVAKSPEILLLSAVTWCFVVCGAAMYLQFSSAMGALIAGVSMAAFPYSLEVVAKIRSLRDFFVTLFFVSLGLLLKTPTPFILLATLVLTIVTVLTRFLTIWPMVRLLRYGDRVGVLSSIHLSQTSEFGLVVALIGIQLAKPHIGEDVLTLIVLALVATSTVSTYMIQFSHQIAARLVREGPQVALAGGGSAPAGGHADEGHSAGGHGAGAPIMLIGCFRIGSSLVHELHKAKREFSVVDFNPLLADGLGKLHVPFTYGDISFMDTLEHAGVDKAKVLVASIPDDFLRGIDNKKLLQTLRKVNPGAAIIVTAENLGVAAQLYDAGADYVLVQRILSAEHLAGVIDDALAGNLATRKNESVDRLRGRDEVVP